MSLDDIRLLRDAFGCFMTGVTVVTTLAEDGTPIGFTANSFSSVSLDPPLLLVSVSNRSASLDHFTRGRGFAVNILSEGQKALSNTFARPSEDRFDGIDWSIGPFGAPVLAGASAWFDCSLERAIEAGDHTILLGRVEGFEAGTAPGLGYYRGAYMTPAITALSAEAGPRVVITAIIENEGRVYMTDDGTGGIQLPEIRVDRSGARAALSKLIAETGTTAEPGLVYAIYDDNGRGLQFIAHLCPARDTSCTRGAFVALDETALSDVTDPAQHSMLERFASEYRMGNFGQYTGSHEAGDILSFSRG
ncbi:flavin reductase family protein [Paenirhodobacter enshiensis]|uniref:flavin reductase family protein n=1 Tax=Paenirhodobacter enshiensis TaxID=1105367 RepID=UPI003FA24264